MEIQNYNDFMHEFIKKICDEIGPRASASENEKKAGDKIEENLKKYCDDTHQEEFKLAPKAVVGNVRWAALLIIISGVLYEWVLFNESFANQLNPTMKLIIFIISPVLITISLSFLILEVMLLREFIDFIFPKKKAYNIIGTIKPKNEIKNNLIFAAHHDSAYEYKLFYYLKTFGAVIIFLGFIGAILTFIYVWLRFLFNYSPIYFRYFLIFFVPIGLAFFFFVGKNATLGAYDNLSGVAILIAIAKYISENRNNPEIFPNNAQIQFISFACEEAGLRGSRRYVKAHEKELKSMNTKVINIDSISMKDNIVIVKREIFTGVKHNEELSEELFEIGKKLGIGIKFGSLPFGGSDAVPFTWKKIPVTSFMTFEMPKLPPYYHTRMDNPDVVDKEALGQVFRICIEYLKKINKS
ncbi:MAG: M28 family metallopeptidase [Promethearchaeota archaeon]